jgi:hypothetical protein
MKTHEHCKTLAVATLLLALAAHSLSAPHRLGSDHAGSASLAAQTVSHIELTKSEQRSLFRHCVYTAKVTQGHMDELTHSALPQPKVDEIRQHLREVQSVVASMFDDHKRLRDSLTEEQWTASKDQILALEKLRADIQAYIQGIDVELQIPDPDAKMFIRYGKKIRTALKEWQKQHQRMAAAIGNKF